MSRTSLLLIGALLLLSGLVFGQSGLGLSVNGQLIVPAGQLESFVYNPAEGRVKATTFFGDIRCTPEDQSSPGSLVFELDKFSSLESEASYQILGSGEVTYAIADSLINVVTSSPSPSPNCVHFIPAVGTIDPATGETQPGTFWVGDFEAPFSLDAEVTSPAIIGSILTIRFKLTNVSTLLVGTDILAQFVSQLTPTTGEITGPVYSPAGAVLGDVWQVPILWPGESATLDVSYGLGSLADAGVEIRTSIDAVTSFDRTGAEPLATGGLQITVVNTSTAQ